ncbi:MAG: hypothetical protein QNK92_16130 [Amylibacter sp.]
MGVTVMIIMELLSVLAISSIDFDQFDEIRARIEEARAEQEGQEETFEDTSELGWLDVSDNIGIGQFPDNLLTFATAQDASAGEVDAETKTSTAAGPEGAGVDDDTDLFDDIFAEDTELDPELSADATYDLWPFEDQSDETDVAEEDTKDGELIEVAAYEPTLDKMANDLPPEVSVAGQNGSSEMDVNEDALAQTASTDFKGLEPEGELLKQAA